MGSFACCQAWRLHLREGNKKEQKLAKGRWSVCMECGERLKWYDNIPVASWLMLGGKCRRCGKKIGGWEIGSEVGMGLVFVIFGMFFWWGFDGGMAGGEAVRYWLMAGILMAMLVGMGVLLVADARWGRLPVVALTFCIACAILYVLTKEWGVFDVSQIWNYLGALAVLPGLYFFLYKMSGEKWVGSGDWLLALPMALVLGEFWLGFLVLFLANLMGCLVMIPVSMAKNRGVGGVKVALGPFLIGAFCLVYLVGGTVLGWLGVG